MVIMISNASTPVHQFTHFGKLSFIPWSQPGISQTRLNWAQVPTFDGEIFIARLVIWALWVSQKVMVYRSVTIRVTVAEILVFKNQENI